jgi:hypothetical protein
MGARWVPDGCQALIGGDFAAWDASHARTITTASASRSSRWNTIGIGHMRREVVPAHDTVSALSAHVSIRFFSIANIELGGQEQCKH